MNEQSPETKAAAAAESLAAEGFTVTARAVRERAGVNMKVASDAARVWNDAQVAAGTLPELPTSVHTRMVGMWGEAVREARVSFEGDRQAWEAQRRDDAQERAELESALAVVEAERDEARATVAQVTGERDDARAELVEAVTATARAEGRAEQAEKAQERAEDDARSAREALAEAERQRAELAVQLAAAQGGTAAK